MCVCRKVGRFVSVAQTVIGRVSAATGGSDQTLFVAVAQIKHGHSHNAALLQKQINTSSDRRCASAPTLLSSLPLPLLPFFGGAVTTDQTAEHLRLKKITAKLLGLFG